MLLFDKPLQNPRDLRATAPNVSAMSSTARHEDRARSIVCAHGAPYGILHRYGCECYQFHGEELCRKKRKGMREWREVEEASSVVIVPGNVIGNDHRGVRSSMCRQMLMSSQILLD
jgi:hypothetical protein